MAATDVIAELAVNLKLDSTAFARGSTVAGARAKALKGQMTGFQKSIGGVSSALKGMGGFFVGGFLAGGVAGAAAEVAHFASKGLDLAASLGETSQQLGVTSDDLQKYRYAASQVGIEQDAMDKGLQRLTRSLGQAATGKGPAAKAFTDLGINIRDANGHIKTAGEIIPELADKLKALPDAASRAAVEVALFGKTGQQLDTLLAGGAAGVNSLTEAASKLGLVLSPEQIRKADDARDKLDALKQVLEAKIAGFAADNADTILKLANAAADLGTKAFAGLDGFNKWASGVQARLSETGKSFGDIQARADAFDKRMGIPTQQQFVNSVDAEIKRIHDLLNQDLADVQTWAAAVDKSLLSAWHSFSTNWDRITAKTASMVSAVKDRLTSGLAGAWETVKQKTSEAGDHFHNLWDRVVGHSYMPDMVDGIEAQMQRLETVLVTPAKSATGKAGDAFRDLASRTSGLLDQLFPDAAQNNQLVANAKTLDDALKSNIITFSTWAQARTKLDGTAPGPADIPGLDPGPLTQNMKTLQDVFGEFTAANDDIAATAKHTGAEIAQAYGDMATNVIGSVKNLVSQLKGGDILGALQTVLGVVQSVVGVLSSTGVIHGATPAPRAQGGPVVPGRTYLVGERGPEYVRFGGRGYVQPAKGGGQTKVMVVPSPLFEVVVRQQAAGVAAPMAGQAAMAGAAGGMSGMSRRASRQIP